MQQIWRRLFPIKKYRIILGTDCRILIRNRTERIIIIRIYAEPFAYNTASCRVLEKAGFQYEGTLRKNAVKNGEVIDMKMYSLLKEKEEKDLQEVNEL